MRALIITLDGPAGSGKSTVARRLAKRLGLEFLDTGAMYRGVAAACVEAGIDPAKGPQAVAEMVGDMEMFFDWKTDPPRLHVRQGGTERDFTDRLRDADVTAYVSQVASIPAVRQVLVANQRRIGQQHWRLVTEGRDQGSVVFPKARVKFYLDAAAQVRARRRAEQLRQANRPADESEILRQIELRDQRDSTRKDGPLICPEDAVRLDTSDMSLDEVVDYLEQRVRAIAGLELASSSSHPSGRK